MAERSVRSKQIRAGLARAAALGHPLGRPQKVTDQQMQAAIPLGTAAGSRAVGLGKSQFILRRRRLKDHLPALAPDRGL